MTDDPKPPWPDLAAIVADIDAQIRGDRKLMRTIEALERFNSPEDAGGRPPSLDDNAVRDAVVAKFAPGGVFAANTKLGAIDAFIEERFGVSVDTAKRCRKRVWPQGVLHPSATDGSRS